MIKLFGLRIYTKSDFVKVQANGLDFEIPKATYAYIDQRYFLMKTDLISIAEAVNKLKKVKKWNQAH